MSASSTPTVNPSAAIAAARLTVTDDLPTPPLPLATARIRVDAGISVLGAFSRAFQRALVITSDRSSLVISPQSILTLVTPGCTATLVSTSFLICARSGQPPIVSLTPTVTTPSSLTSTDGTMPSVTMSAPPKQPGEGFSYEMFFDGDVAADDEKATFGPARERRRRLGVGTDAPGCHARLQGRPRPGRLLDQQPQRQPHVRLRPGFS